MENGESSYRRFLESDEQAFEQLIKEYFDPLVFFIDSFVRDIYASEDIAIDAFAYILANKGKYNFKVSFKTYLFMIGRSRALNYIKRKKLLKISSLEDIEDTVSDQIELEKAVLDNEAKRIINKAVDELPEKMRSAVHLVYFQNMTYAQAARVLGKNEKQIDNLLYRAKGLLKEHLGKDGEALL